MRTFTFAAMWLAASNGLCQTPAKEPDTLQSLLAEVRGLRQDIQAMTVASQRVQIALYGLQLQAAAVGRAAQRLDDARNRRIGAETGRDHTSAEIQSMESRLAAGALSGDETVALRSHLPQMKSELETQTAESQARMAAEAEASSQLQSEQAKLAELQDRIERLDKALEKLGNAGK
jgi:chromosome segregation ATPase